MRPENVTSGRRFKRGRAAPHFVIPAALALEFGPVHLGDLEILRLRCS
jgi:hypothetical protein